ncbi:hypothetical protein LL912_07580 [Niabella sp. CC-SYL272]|uniref:hypothetical protein n=1 Tax=Niabella agricola TaxID=2891571 RepID=UPI001F45BD45|nr:hypothetical protein [Niabella agricola]MCF3108635.1 hypothetical protein [Niabella agricola]
MSLLKLLLSLLLFFMIPTAHSQVHWFIRPEGNLSIIRKTDNTTSYPTTIDNVTVRANVSAQSDFNRQLSAGLSGGMRIPTIVKRLSLETSAGLVMTSYRAHTILKFISTGDIYRLNAPGSRTILLIFDGYAGGFTGDPVNGNFSYTVSPETTEKNFKLGQVHHLYAQLNLGANYQLLKHTAIGLSAAPYLLVKSTTHMYTKSAQPPLNPPLFKETKSSSKDNYHPTGLAGRAAIEQTVSTRLAIQASFTHHFSKIYKGRPNDIPGRKPRMQYAALGLSYYFH